jgi:hypothetical protein
MEAQRSINNEVEREMEKEAIMLRKFDGKEG